VSDTNDLKNNKGRKNEVGMDRNYLENNRDECIVFDSDFESGNLDLVF